MNKTPQSQRPQRRQIEYRDLSLDQWLDEDHRVRYVWQYVESLDLSELYDAIKAIQGNVGRPPIDPQILFALWLFATIEGVTSARKIAELTKQHIAYMWRIQAAIDQLDEVNKSRVQKSRDLIAECCFKNPNKQSRKSLRRRICSQPQSGRRLSEGLGLPKMNG